MVQREGEHAKRWSFLSTFRFPFAVSSGRPSLEIDRWLSVNSIASTPATVPFTSQSRSVLSLDPDARCLPSGENATAVTQKEWSSSILSEAPLVGFQSRTVLLYDPDAKSLPSDETATSLIQPEWPSSVQGEALLIDPRDGPLCRRTQTRNACRQARMPQHRPNRHGLPAS